MTKHLLIIALTFIAACNQSSNSEVNISELQSKFKFDNLIEFKTDTISWHERINYYSVLDSAIVYKLYQDSTLRYYEPHERSIDLYFLYSWQESSRSTIELTVLSQFEGEYCDKIDYLIYNLDGLLIDNYTVARSCGDGIYWRNLYSKVINDSTLMLKSTDNYKTPDTDNIDEPDILTIENRIIRISESGKFIELEKAISIDTIR